MKLSEVRSVLHVATPTIYRYLDRGYIKATRKPSGQWEYDRESVYQFLNHGAPRKICLYGRVSTYKQKVDLQNQMHDLEIFAKKRGYTISNEFSDIASGISFKQRTQFFKLLDLVINNQVSKVVITHKNRLSRVGFDLFKHLFEHYGTEIVIMSDYLDEKTDEQELLSEIIALLHCFTMKSDASRRKLRSKLS